MRTFTKITLSLCIGLAIGMGQAVAGAKPDQWAQNEPAMLPVRFLNGPEVLQHHRQVTAQGITTQIRSRMTHQCFVSPVPITRNMRIS